MIRDRVLHKAASTEDSLLVLLLRCIARPRMEFGEFDESGYHVV